MVENRVEITNHVYHYIIKLSEKDSTKLKKQFDAKVEQIRLEYENDIKSQINNTLNTILEKVLNDKNGNDSNT
jgi:F0F1-type ATP synthase membrane subunit b/b'